MRWRDGVPNKHMEISFASRLGVNLSSAQNRRLSAFSHVKLGLFLPKCPYAAVSRYMGRLRSSIFIIPAGLMSKFFLT
jgi:hypothetical protein